MQKPEKSEDGLTFGDDIGELKRKSFRGGMAFAIAQACQIVLQVVSTVVLARLLTPADFGLAAMVAPFAVAIAVISDLGLGQAVVQRRELTSAHLSNLFWVSLAFHLVLLVIFLALTPLVGMFYDRPVLTTVAAVYCSLFLINGLGSLHRSVQTRRLQFGRLGAFRFSSMLFGICVGIFIAAQWHTFWALVAIPVATSLAGLTLSWLGSGWRPGLPDRRVEVRSMIGFGGNVASVRIMNFISSNADSVMIGKLWGEVALGYYDRAYRLMVTPTNLITAPLANMAPTVFARLFDNPESYRRAVLGLMRLVLLAAIPAMAFAIVMAPQLIPLVYGDAWDQVIPIFQAFGIAALLRFQLVMLEWLFVAEDRTREFRNWAVIRTVLMVGSFAVGLPWGGLGVATAYAGAMLFLMLPWLIFVVTRRSHIRIADIGLTFAVFLPGTIVAVGAMVAVTATTTLPEWATLLVCLALSYGIIWAAAWLFPAGRRSFRLGLEVLRHARPVPPEAV
ncbi:lipopolysaccharide biosynthesis protein [Emcibacter sp. SYSU 3D8]|uniref:lipopolysaccharide biosynthesis protein n=1 Tax=Emcibacter sp. SYSU 3D8 TaxID=3133969 RepID=UPI0031FF2899